MSRSRAAWRSTRRGDSATTAAQLSQLATEYDSSAPVVLASAVLVLLSRYLRTDSPAVAMAPCGGGEPRILAVEISSATRLDAVVAEVRRQMEAGASPEPAAGLVQVVVGSPSAAAALDGPQLVVSLERDGVAIRYRAGALAQWLVDQFAAHLARLIEIALADPGAQVSRLPLLDDEAAIRCLALAAGPFRRYPLDRPLIELFDQQVAADEDAPAVIEEDEAGRRIALSYRSLNERSRRLASRLRALGAAEGSPVALLAARSSDSVAALLAIWRIGGLYVPIDASAPDDYVRFILEDSGAGIVVAEASPPASALPSGVRALNLADSAEGPDEICADLDGARCTAAPCLIMYTSGSTGRPKGVVHCQRQIINRLNWMWEAYPFATGAVIAERSPLSVMPSMWELLGGLLAGRPTAIVPYSAMADPPVLAAFLARHRVSFATFTPTVLRLLLEAIREGAPHPDALKTVIVGGEPLTDSLYREFRGALPQTVLVNDFGATEVNTILHIALGGGARFAEGASLRPIANVSAFVLDEFLRPVPYGIEGELCVAGESLALGYHARSEETESRFVELALPRQEERVRLYRTGDLAVMRPDGGIRIRGRRDHQVKINGYRVETGEVEAALAEHDGIAAAIVLARDSGAGRLQLEAHLTRRPGSAAQAREVRAFAVRRLPPHMVPSRFHWVESLPRRPNGKLDRLALADRLDRIPSPGAVNRSRREIAESIRAAVARILDGEADTLDGDSEFFALGLDSLSIIDLARTVAEIVRRPVPPGRLFDYPTINRLSAFLAGPEQVARGGGGAAPVDSARGKVAIVGMSGRFAGAADLGEFWQFLREGVDCTGPIPPDRSGLGGDEADGPLRGGFLPAVDRFDPAFFAISPSDARAMDPQQRLGLMEAWHALEDAGLTGSGLSAQRIGTFVGAGPSGYDSVLSGAGRPPDAGSLLGNDLSLIAARIAYFCDLQGPAMVVTTACSSSLVAVHLACRSLADDECTIALAGGVSITNGRDFLAGTGKLNVLSPDDTCRAFDEAANGFVHGEGVGFVVLKPLARALEDNDRIYAVICGTAINQDGRSNGITSPNGLSQTELQTRLYERLALDPGGFGYVEAHGTGTPLGDPIEVRALTDSFRQFTSRRGYCALGSVKTNIGHATAAAGIAGLIKAALCVYHGTLVPSLHFNRPNPLIDLPDSPFYVNVRTSSWRSPRGQPRRAALNSFGIGGTNAHCVLEQAPAPPSRSSAPGLAHLVPVTAPDPEGVARVSRALQGWVGAHLAEDLLADASYSLLAGRRRFDHGHLLLARDMRQLHEQLGALAAGEEPDQAWRLAGRGEEGSDASRAVDRLLAELNGLRRGESGGGDEALLLAHIAHCVAAGARPDWTLLYRGDSPRRLSLPGYPFAEGRYWPHSTKAGAAAPGEAELRPPSEAPLQPLDRLVGAVADLLGIEPEGLDRTVGLDRLGLDSIRAGSLKLELERSLHIEVPLHCLLAGQSVDQIAMELGLGAEAGLVQEPARPPPEPWMHPVWQADDGAGSEFPLTELQAAHLVAKLSLDDDPVGCHNYLEFTVDDLDFARLESAWRRLVELHPMLHARVLPSGVQRIEAKEAPPFVRYEVPASSLSEHLDRVRFEMSHRRYLPSEWPLYEIRVTCPSGSAARVHVGMDSWIADAGSAELIYRDWRSLYDSRRQGPPPAAGFRDFVHTMTGFAGSAGYRRCSDYWSKKLRLPVASPALPYREADAQTAGGHRRRRIRRYYPRDRWEQFVEAVRSQQVSPSVALLGLFIEELRRFDQPERFGLILTAYGRPPLHPDIGRIVGPFSSTILFVGERDQDGGLGERLLRCQAQVADDLDHGYIGAGAAMRLATGVVGGGSRLPIVFTSAISLAASAQAEPSWLDQADHCVSQTPGIDLHLLLHRCAGGVEVAFDAALDRFRPGAIEALFQSLCQAVDRVAALGAAAFAEPEPTPAPPERAAAAAVEIAMTPLQQSYGAHRLIHPQAPPALIYREFEIRDLDSARLEAALNRLIAERPALRSAKSLERAKLIVLPHAHYPLNEDDLRDVAGEARDRLLDRIRAELLEDARALRAWPPFLLRAVRLPGGRDRLHLALDPITFDGVGVWQFYADLLAAYAGEPPPAPAGVILPEDRDAADPQAAAARGDEEYWRHKFAALPAGPALPGPGTAERGNGRCTLDIPQWDEVSAAAAERGLAALPLLAALYVEALRRAGGGSAPTVVVVDYPERPLDPSLADAYGDHSSLAWLASDGKAAASIADEARSMTGILREDRLHAPDDPLAVLRRERARDPSGSSFRAVLTNALNAPDPYRPGIREAFAWSSTPGVDLDLVVRRHAGGLACALQYDPERVSPLAAEALLRHLDTLLGALADPAAWARPLGEIGAPARPHGPPGLVGPAVAYARSQSLPGLVELQAARTPHQLAVIAADAEYSFAQLDARANRLAHHLLGQGVAAGRPVGILLSPAAETIVCLLAVLKAGAAYVPLRPSDPPARVAAMLRQAKIDLVIASTEHSSLLPPGQRRILVDALADEILQQQPHRPGIEVRATDIAYVMFTSGTTGEPKGVVVQHRPVVNLIEWAHRAYRFSSADRVLLVNSLGFDLSVFDIFGLLAAGGSVRIVAEHDRLDPNRIADLLLAGDISFWNSAPSYLQYVIPALRSRLRSGGRNPGLRLIFLSGDRIGLDLAATVRAALPAAELVALGGATEATVWSNVFPIDSVDPGWTGIPYGRPIQNARYYVLDGELRPCPEGAAGELFIGGECLAAGYVNAPGLTAERFLGDPFHEDVGQRMYRTGDLVRLLPGGDLDFLGRSDNQVKIRGFRVELAEVEAGLARAGLPDAVAVAREDSPGALRLVAFAAPAQGRAPPDEAGLRARLAETLPNYMAPSELVLLKALPMTDNGKVDRRRLATAPLDSLIGAVPPESAAAPLDRPGPAGLIGILRDALETILVAPGSSIEADTHFSTLGVSSLHFAVLSARLADELKVAISPAKLFRCTSLAEVAATVERELPVAAAPSPGPAAATAPAPQSPGEAAIIGMYCRFPEAEGLDSFWRNLETGRDCLGTVPPTRWDWRACYGDSAGKDDRTTANRGGFITGIACFDARFFGISPREAELMDPRQRLLLEGVWSLLEESGYRPSALRGQSVGVFIGATGDEYASLLQQSGRPADQFSLTGTARSLLANRISYHFGWHGPSETVDTTCSSSLVALHNAMRAIGNGDCSLAVVGGLNIMIDPAPHLSLAKIGVLSPDSTCRTFDRDANGYVRGEGLGLILIKPLACAESERDQIYAVVSGSAVNHGGRANALTAPNPAAQARVITEAHRRGGLDPRHVGYIEAHGTGTPLGDPIEIEGLKEAFAELATGRGAPLPHGKTIAVGSVKSSIGHLEAAAGIAGVIKTALMIRRRILPPQVHLKTRNPQIEIEGTPFYFPLEAQAWPAPSGADGKPGTRVAGVSSFGLGGVNAHVVLREHPLPEPAAEPSAPSLFAIPLSARTDAQLAIRVESLRATLEGSERKLRFEDVAFTLRVGREAFEIRAVVLASSLAELVSGLGQLAGDGEGGSLSGSGRPSSRQIWNPVDPLAASEEGLAAAWMAGAPVDWDLRDSGRRARRVRLPAYPFQRIEHWPECLGPRGSGANQARPPLPVSGLSGEAVMSWDSSLAQAHRIRDRRIAPAALYLSLLAAAADRARPGAAFVVKGFTWLRPLLLEEGESRSLRLRATPAGDEQALSLVSVGTGPPEEHASGSLLFDVAAVPQATVDLAAIRTCCPSRHDEDECYRRLAGQGIAIGGGLRVVRELWVGPEEALARIATGPGDEEWPRLPIAAADSCFQTSALHALFTADDEAEGRCVVPFSASRIRVRAPLPSDFFVHARVRPAAERSREGGGYDIVLVSPAGEVLLSIEGFSGRSLGPGPRPRAGRLQAFAERWVEHPEAGPPSAEDLTGVRHITVGLSSLAEGLSAAGAEVMANLILPRLEGPPPEPGSAVAWSRWLGPGGEPPPRAMALWYDCAAVARLSVQAQLKFGFDTVYELARQLIALRAECEVAIGLLCAAGTAPPPSLEALAGLLRSVRSERPTLRFRLLRCATDSFPDAGDALPLLRTLGSVLRSGPDDSEHRLTLDTGRHEVRRIERAAASFATAVGPTWSDGVYVVAGGAGAVGSRVACEIADRAGTVAVLGRRPAGQVPGAASARDPGRIRYFEADLTDRRRLSEALDSVRAELGPIRGVIHCAGVVAGGLILRTPLADARRAIEAKTLGCELLDELTASDPLKFFLIFSSLASILGPVGAAGYGYACRYADLYAEHRARLADGGLRQGKSITVSWPLWSAGGLRPSASELEHLRHHGIDEMDTASALLFLAERLSGPSGHYLCAAWTPHCEAFLTSYGTVRRPPSRPVIREAAMLDKIIGAA